MSDPARATHDWPAHLLADLRNARVQMTTHLPLLLLGTTTGGLPYSTRGLVRGARMVTGGPAWVIDVAGDPGPSLVRWKDGTWLHGGIEWFAYVRAKRRAAKHGRLPDPADDPWIFEPWHFEPLANPYTRVGFLLLCDEAVRRGHRVLDWTEDTGPPRRSLDIGSIYRCSVDVRPGDNPWIAPLCALLAGRTPIDIAAPMAEHMEVGGEER